MLPWGEYKKVLDKMNECMIIPEGLFNRLKVFNCKIFENFDEDWREVTEIRSLAVQFESLIYPIGTVKKLLRKS